MYYLGDGHGSLSMSNTTDMAYCETILVTVEGEWIFMLREGSNVDNLENDDKAFHCTVVPLHIVYRVQCTVNKEVTEREAKGKLLNSKFQRYQ